LSSLNNTRVAQAPSSDFSFFSQNRKLRPVVYGRHTLTALNLPGVPWTFYIEFLIDGHQCHPHRQALLRGSLTWHGCSALVTPTTQAPAHYTNVTADRSLLRIRWDCRAGRIPSGAVPRCHGVDPNRADNGIVLLGRHHSEAVDEQRDEGTSRHTSEQSLAAMM
jgi:hypothetical protein